MSNSNINSNILRTDEIYTFSLSSENIDTSYLNVLNEICGNVAIIDNMDSVSISCDLAHIKELSVNELISSDEASLNYITVDMSLVVNNIDVIDKIRELNIHNYNYVSSDEINSKYGNLTTIDCSVIDVSFLYCEILDASTINVDTLISENITVDNIDIDIEGKIQNITSVYIYTKNLDVSNINVYDNINFNDLLYNKDGKLYIETDVEINSNNTSLEFKRDNYGDIISLISNEEITFNLDSSGNINANDIKCNDVSCNIINCLHINTNTISCESIESTKTITNEISTNNLNCVNLNGDYIECNNISGEIFESEYINVEELSCNDIYLNNNWHIRNETNTMIIENMNNKSCSDLKPKVEIDENGDFTSYMYNNCNINSKFKTGTNSDGTYVELKNSSNSGYKIYSTNDNTLKIKSDFRDSQEEECFSLNEMGILTVQSLRTTSDIKLKNDIRDISGIDLIKQLKPKKYNKNGITECGLIAQDVLNTDLSYCVSTDGEYYTIDYNSIFVHAIKAIQEINNDNNLILKELESFIPK